MKPVRIWILLITMFTLLLLPAGMTAARPALEVLDPPVGGTTPYVLVSENVQNISVQGAKVWWSFVSPCAPTEEMEGDDFRVEEIGRVATTGSGSSRLVFSHDESNIFCGDWSRELLSNVEADDEFLYWMSNEHDGLVKLSVDANENDPSTLVYDGQSQADEIRERGDYVYLMNDDYGIIRVHKTTSVADTIVTAVQLGGYSTHLQVTDDYVYWLEDENLKVALANGGGGDGIAIRTTGYVAENALCPPSGPCATSEYSYFAQDDQVRRYDLDTDTFGPVLYDSSVANAVVREMTVDDDFLYFFEMRPGGCDPFCTYDHALIRLDLATGGTDTLYFITETLFSQTSFDLTLGGPSDDYLFWTDEGELKRLASNAEGLPSIDLDITDIEVTQAIQDLDNSVTLIRDKRTGVRVHVDAAGQNVAGVTARLYRLNNGGSIIDGPISPSAGTNPLTVPNNPDRANFNHAFYFQLPSDWIDGTTLRLGAQINPNQLPPEPDYTNNTQMTSVLTVQASPTLRTHLLVWGYTVDGTYYQPDTVQDVWQARSWIRRTYPLASTTGGYDSPDPGLRLKIRTIPDGNLGAHIERTSDLCLGMPEDDRNLCAATYTNNCAKWLRATEGIPNDELIYSMIWDDPGLPFPRGFATGGVSSGPTGPGTWGWDTDGSYGDWYMGHEVGHNVGRGHPSQGNSCGHSASDPGFPYPGAAIGSGDMWGFDVGDIGLNGALTPRVYPNSQWTDMMGYCSRQWISDYTFEGIYDFLTPREPSQTTFAPVRAGSDYIALFGTIFDDSDIASFQVVGLWDSPGPYALPTGSAYQMRFLDSGNNELATYDFDGDANDAEPNMYGFEVVVPFPPETTHIELVRNSDSQLLTTHTLSANPPTVSNITLVDAPSPVTGIVTLEWEASDPDGDSLTFDVYYTNDDGATYTAYALALSNSSIELDTSQMGGSTQARFRVTANDGTRLAEAESETFTMANKPPTVTILTPQDNLEVTYGTTVHVEAEVEDLQGHIPDSDMEWYLNGETTTIMGPSYSASLLPIGSNQISLRVTNSAGQMTETSITIIVNDNLDYPGPMLTVGPDQLGWQLEEGTTDTQQATLNISNMGTGNLSWTASEDANWLTLSHTSGDTPDILTVTVDPTLVTPDAAVETLITIEGDNGQSLELPVSLLVGESQVWYDPPRTQSYEIYLPLTVR